MPILTPADIYSQALGAANSAIAAELALQPEDPMAFDCGFAWVIVRPARGPFIQWCKDRDLGGKAYGGGWQFWCPGSWHGQSVRVWQKGAQAFAQALSTQGLKATWDSRLD